MLDGLSAFAGRPLTVDEDVFESERATGDRNRAIAYLMRSAGLLDEDVEQQIANYFRQCSIVVTAQDLAVMTATLANAGVNPLTGVEVIPRHVVASVLTVMATCGMYDSSGEWLYRVGLPAKSGVSGAVAAVLPGQLGLAAHSPRLDPQGNSVRGVAACERISERLGLHLLLPGERVRSGLRRSYRADTARSRRLRDQGQRDVLDAQGTSIVVYELGGDEAFAAVEPLVRVVLDDDDAQWVVIDMRRVTRIDTAALTLLDGLIAQLASAGTAVGIVEPRAQGPRIAVRDLDHALPRFPDADAALEWCETQLLHEHGLDNAMPEEMIPLAQQDLLLGLPAEIVTAIEERVVTKVFHAGTVVFEEGDESDGLYFVGCGTGRRRRAAQGPRRAAAAEHHRERLVLRRAGPRRRPAPVDPDRRDRAHHLLHPLPRGLRRAVDRVPRRLRQPCPGHRPQPLRPPALLHRRRGRARAGLSTAGRVPIWSVDALLRRS